MIDVLKFMGVSLVIAALVIWVKYLSIIIGFCGLIAGLILGYSIAKSEGKKGFDLAAGVMMHGLILGIAAGFIGLMLFGQGLN